MAFCPYCGKPVNDGEVCSCQAAPAPQPVSQAAAPQYAPQAAPQPVSQAAAPQAAPQYAPQPQAAPQYAPQPQAAPQAAAPQYAPQPQTAPQAAAPQYAPQAAPQAAAPQYAPQPQAAPQAAAPQYAPQPQAAPQYAQQPQQYVPAQPAGPNAFNDFIGVFPKAVINPTETAEGVGKKVKISHAIIWGGVFAFSVFLMFILFYIRHLSAGKTFLLAFMNALTYSMIIAASAAFIMGVSRNKEAGYPRVLGAICIETIPISCLALFVGLWGLLIYSSISFFSSIFAILFAMGIERTFRYFASGLSRTKQFLLSAAVVGIICSIQYMMIDLFLYKLIW